MKFRFNILLIAVLLTNKLSGQHIFDFSADIGTKIGTYTYNELPQSSPNIDKRYFNGFSPLFQLKASFQKNRFRIGFVYQSREIILRSGFNLKSTNEHPGGGAGRRTGFFYKQFSLQFGFIFQKSLRWEQSLNLQLSYFQFKADKCLSNPASVSGGGISFSSCGSASSGAININSDGVIVDQDIGVAKDFVFQWNNNIYLGVNYNLKYFLNQFIFLNLNLQYDQGIFALYTSDSTFDYINYETGQEVSFEHQIQSKLSNFNFTIGLGYRIN